MVNQLIQLFITLILFFNILYIKNNYFPMEEKQKYLQQKKDYNSKLSTFQISKELHKLTKEYCKSKNLKVREFLEELISKNINNS